MPETDLYTVETAFGTFTDQTAHEVSSRLVANIDGDNPIIVSVQRPISEYVVLYGGTVSMRKHTTDRRGWNQAKTLKAKTHRQAGLAAAQRSQHSDGTRYMVVGPDRTVSGGEEIVARTYIINSVENAEQADFSVHSPRLQHYTFAQIAL
jgi:hypothetical protein